MAYQVFESSVFNKLLAAEGRILWVPSDVAAEVGVSAESDAPPSEVLGVQLGVPIHDGEGVADVFYASLQGRVYTFDPNSFGRWRPRRQAERTEESLFAEELALGDRAPVSQSPLQLDSISHLVSQGEAYVANGADWVYQHPLHALGVVVLVRGAVLISAVGRAAQQTIVIAAKYHLRRKLGVPVDWLPPEDHD